jgi:hypothetical protein
VKKYLYILPLIFLFACEDVPEYADEPIISFEGISKYVVVDPFTTNKTDSIVISLAFTDGDGDLGLSQDEAGSGIFVGDSSNNFHVEVERKNSGAYEVVDLELDGLFYPLVNEQYLGPIDGVLEHSISFNHNLVTELSANDTVRFRVSIYDRSLNKSNTVVTSDILVLQ